MGLSLEERMSLDDDLKALDDLRHAMREYYEMDFGALYNFQVRDARERTRLKAKRALRIIVDRMIV